MDAIGISGIASGIDFRALIAEIVRVESRPIDLVEERVAATQRRIEGWKEFQGRLDALRTASAALSGGGVFSRMSAQVAGGGNALRATVTGEPAAGTSRVQANHLATAERLGSRWFDGGDVPLGLEGSFRVAGRSISVTASDSLADVADRINRNAADGATASLVSGAEGQTRLVVTGARTGAAGLALADGPGAVLRELGLLGEGTTLNHVTSDGLASDPFRDSATPLGELVGTGAGAGSIRIGALTVSLDLGTQSLADVASAINGASASAGSRVAASVESGEGGSRLVIRGSTDVEDDGGILEALGVLVRVREPAARRVEGSALASGGVAASVSTRLSELDGFDGLPAGTVAGDTLTVNGVRGDGSSFSLEVALDGTTTLQHVLDALNGASGFGGGARPAVASLSPEGRIVVEDGRAGASELSLSMVAHNQGGGTLSPGGFVVAREGYAVVLSEGRDAEVEVDGVRIRSASNVLDSVVPGLSIQLTETTGAPVEISISRDRAAPASAVQALVTAYNAVVDFVRAQAPGPLPEGATRPPLASDGALRSMSSRLRSALTLPLLPADSPFTALSGVGVTVNREGRYEFDRVRFEAALERDAAAVSALFATRMTGPGAGLTVVGHTPATREGSYPVTVTQSATRAEALGAPLPGGYPADTDPDLLTVRDLGGGGRYRVELVGGMTSEAIAAALNTAFDTPTTRRIELPEWRGTGGVPVSEDTLLVELEDGEGPLGIGVGETLTLSGTSGGGTPFLRSLTVGAAGAATLGDLLQEVRDTLGPGAAVSLEGGRVRIEGVAPGPGSFDLALSATGPGDTVVPLGPATVLEEGRGRARLAARVEGGALAIRALDPGTASGFEVELEGVGTDHTTQLGLSAGPLRGIDVEGTIGGVAAIGTGDRLLGAAGSPSEGLSLRIGEGVVGELGPVEFARGVAARLEEAVRALLREGSGGVPGVLASADETVARLNDRIQVMEARLARRRDALIRRFTAMEEAVARAQSQSNWLASQLGSLSTLTRNNGRGST